MGPLPVPPGWLRPPKLPWPNPPLRDWILGPLTACRLAVFIASWAVTRRGATAAMGWTAAALAVAVVGVVMVTRRMRRGGWRASGWRSP